MAEAPTKVVKGMPHAFVSQDLTLVEMEFEFENDERERLQFSMPLFEKLLGRAGQLVGVARSRTLAKGDHLAIQTVGVAEITAQAPAGGGKVILLMLRGDNGIPMYFAVPLDMAERLQPEISAAIKAAKKEGSQSRH